MSHRSRNRNQGRTFNAYLTAAASAVEAAEAVAKLHALLKSAVSRGVCPECGGKLVRRDDRFLCITHRCGSFAAIGARLDAHETALAVAQKGA